MAGTGRVSLPHLKRVHITQDEINTPSSPLPTAGSPRTAREHLPTSVAFGNTVRLPTAPRVVVPPPPVGLVLNLDAAGAAAADISDVVEKAERAHGRVSPAAEHASPSDMKAQEQLEQGRVSFVPISPISPASPPATEMAEEAAKAREVAARVQKEQAKQEAADAERMRSADAAANAERQRSNALLSMVLRGAAAVALPGGKKADVAVKATVAVIERTSAEAAAAAATGDARIVRLELHVPKRSDKGGGRGITHAAKGLAMARKLKAAGPAPAAAGDDHGARSALHALKRGDKQRGLSGVSQAVKGLAVTRKLKAKASASKSAEPPSTARDHVGEEKDRLGEDLVDALTRRTGDDGIITFRVFRDALDEMGLDMCMSSDDVDLLFRSLDRNGGGQLHLEELTAAVGFIINPAAAEPSANRQVSKHVAASLNELIDVNPETNPVNHLRDALSSQASRVIDLFKRWDSNGDGVISKPEFRRGIVDLGFGSCLPTEVDRLFAVFDADASGDISFRELHRMLRKQQITIDAPKVHVEHTAVMPLDVTQLRAQTRSQLTTMMINNEMQEILTGEDNGW